MVSAAKMNWGVGDGELGAGFREFATDKAFFWAKSSATCFGVKPGCGVSSTSAGMTVNGNPNSSKKSRRLGEPEAKTIGSIRTKVTFFSDIDSRPLLVYCDHADRLAHLDRASASGAEGGGFESRVCQKHI